jgi:hypothetical protein
MTADPTMLTLATAGLAATGMTAVAALRGWQNWLDLRRDAIEAQRRTTPRQTNAALRERVRRLEAIANGADL